MITKQEGSIVQLNDRTQGRSYTGGESVTTKRIIMFEAPPISRMISQSQKMIYQLSAR